MTYLRSTPALRAAAASGLGGYVPQTGGLGMAVNVAGALRENAAILGVAVGALFLGAVALAVVMRKPKKRRRRNASSRLPRWSEKSGWRGGDSRTLYAFVDEYTAKVTVSPGGPRIVQEVGPNVRVRIATRAEAEQHWQNPLHPGWRVS